MPRSTEVSVNLPVLLFACGVAIATTMFFGLAQLRHIGVKDLRVTLTDAASKGASGGTRRHVRRGLVMAEVAVAVILVIGAGLLIRTVYNLANVDLGFNRSRLVTFSIYLPESDLCRADDSSADVSASAGRAPPRPWCGGSDGHVRAAAESAAPHGQYTGRRRHGSVGGAVPCR